MILKGNTRYLLGRCKVGNAIFDSFFIDLKLFFSLESTFLIILLSIKKEREREIHPWQPNEVRAFNRSFARLQDPRVCVCANAVIFFFDDDEFQEMLLFDRFLIHIQMNPHRAMLTAPPPALSLYCVHSYL